MDMLACLKKLIPSPDFSPLIYSGVHPFHQFCNQQIHGEYKARFCSRHWECYSEHMVPDFYSCAHLILGPQRSYGSILVGVRGKLMCAGYCRHRWSHLPLLTKHRPVTKQHFLFFILLITSLSSISSYELFTLDLIQ